MIKKKTLPRARPNSPIFWNCTGTNIPNRQHSACFLKSQKALHHSTLVWPSSGLTPCLYSVYRATTTMGYHQDQINWTFVIADVFTQDIPCRKETNSISDLKGAVSRDFNPLCFVHNSIPTSVDPLFIYAKVFSNIILILGRYLLTSQSQKLAVPLRKKCFLYLKKIWHCYLWFKLFWTHESWT